MVTDQKHSSDASSEQEVIRYTEKLAQAFGLNEQNAEMYSTLSGENSALKKQLEDYHSQNSTLERRVKRPERDVGSLKIELEDLDEFVDRETVVDLIHEIIPTLINEKSKGSSYSSESEESDSVEIIEGSHRYQVREKRAIPHKQQRKIRPRKVKRIVV
jgi:predicted nuclease with TOPRIM domain